MDHSISPLLTLKNELLLNAVVRGDLPTVRRLIDRHGAQVNSVNISGMSCLQLAIVNQHSKLAEYLIQKGADIMVTDSKGWSALHDAALADNTLIVKKLIAKGLSPMSTTHQQELVIDVAASTQMELLLCEEMCKAGGVDLAKQYYKYLGLSNIGSTGTAHNSFSKGNRGTLCSPQTAPKCPVSRSGLHSRSNTMSSASPGSTPRCKLGKGSSVTLRHHSAANHSNTSKPSCESPTSATAKTSIETTQVQPTSVTDTSSKATQSKAAIKSLHTHSSFQLQIGLSLLNIDSQVTNLDQDSSESFSKQVLTSPRVRSHRVATRTHSDPATSNPLQAQFHNPRKSKKVSFSNPPMTRTKPSTGDIKRPNSTMEDRDSPTGNDSELSLTEDVLKQLTDIYQEREQRREGNCEDPHNAGMRALRKKPRKSSIVSPQRRRSSTDSRRRSVTFQPEILLHENVISGDAKAVSDMLKSGIIQDVNKMSPAGLTALHQSAIDGNLECAKALICNRANVNCTDCEQWTPLHAAALTGQVEFVRYLLLSGADPSLKNDNGKTAYDITNNAQVRKMLLHAMNGKSPDSNEFSDAEYSGEEEEEYSHNESDSEDENSSSELFPATKDGSQSLKERLGLKHSSALSNTPDPSVSPSPDLDTADSVFVAPRAKQQSPYRQDRGLNDSTSSYSSYEPDRINDLTQSGSHASSDVDKTSEDQGICTMDGSSDCSHRSRMLSEDEGTTRDVLDSELVPGSLDYKFQEACLESNIDAMLKLVKCKKEIDINRVNVSSGITALHHAVLEENYALVQHLITDFEASVHIQDRDNWTPLHAASAVGHLRIAQLLLDSGAKASVLNSSCEFPVDVASDPAMQKLLKNAMLGPRVGTLFQGVLTH